MFDKIAYLHRINNDITMFANPHYSTLLRNNWIATGICLRHFAIINMSLILESQYQQIPHGWHGEHTIPSLLNSKLGNDRFANSIDQIRMKNI